MSLSERQVQDLASPLVGIIDVYKRQVLGSGCVKCKTLENATREALVELGMDTTIDHVTDFSQIAAYGVMTTPALVVDGKVVSYGKVLTKKEAKTIIADARR